MSRSKFPKGEGGFRCLLARYKGSAKQRGYSWELSSADFRALTRGNCVYCGAAPSRSSTYSGPSNSDEAKDFARYLYNGLDRIDNAQGYSLENCCSCCYRCNAAKNTMTRQEFASWLLKVAKKLLPAEMGELMALMKSHSVSEFSFGGLHVKYQPVFHQPDAGRFDDTAEVDAHVAAERVKQAVADFNKINDEDRLNLEWST